MVNGNDLLMFEERNADWLKNSFIKENKEEWEDFLENDGFTLFTKEKLMNDKWNKFIDKEFSEDSKWK